MRTIHLVELRASWAVWLGVCLAFVAVNLALVLSAVALESVLPHKFAEMSDASGMSAYPAVNLFSSIVVGVAIIDSVTNLVIASRRGALARLS